jgi:hypothetical protein
VTITSRIKTKDALVGVFLFASSVAAATCPAPPWVLHPPQTSGECYWVGQGNGVSIGTATTAAWSHVFSQLAMSKVTEIRSEMENVLRETNGVLSDSTICRVESEGFISSDGRKLFKVMETKQTGQECDGLYHYYLLIGVPSIGCRCEKIVPLNGGALFRSALLPGWGQAYKGHTIRGISFGISVAGLAAGAVVCGMLSSQNNNRAADSKTSQTRQYYTTWRDGTYYAEIGLAVAAIAVYVWDLFDANNLRGIPVYK